MKIKDLTFTATKSGSYGNTLYGCNINNLRFTILDIMTGFGYRDVETGFRDTNGDFWLARGGFDIRCFPELELWEAIELIKRNSTL